MWTYIDTENHLLLKEGFAYATSLSDEGTATVKMMSQDRPETIIFTENIENLKLIDVGFDQRETLTPADASEDIYAFGVVLKEVLGQVDGAPAWLRKVADRCTDPDPRRRFRDVVQLRLALQHRTDQKLYLAVIAFLLVMIALLLWFTSPLAPAPN